MTAMARYHCLGRGRRPFARDAGGVALENSSAARDPASEWM